MKRTLLIVIFSVATVVSVLLQAPLAAVLSRVDLSSLGVEFGHVRGVVWNGHVYGITWRGQTLGDARISVSAPALLAGTLKVQVRSADSAMEMVRGTVSWTAFGGIGVSDATASLPIERLPTLLDLSGTVEAAIGEITLASDLCRAEGVSLNANQLSVNIGGAVIRLPDMAGKGSCADDGLVLMLEGQDQARVIGARIQIMPDGRYASRLEIQSDDRIIAAYLDRLGFKAEGGSMVLNQSGRWRT